MRKIFPIISITFSLLFVNCSGDKKNTDTQTGQAAGGAYYGGVLRVNEVDNIKSLMPLSINELASIPYIITGL